LDVPPKVEKRRFRLSDLRVTRGAAIFFGLELGFTLVFLFLPAAQRQAMAEYTQATPANLFEHYRIWTLATSPFLAQSFLGLLMHGVLLFGLISTMERFWGTPRFIRFAILTSVVGQLVGVIAGQLLGHAGVAVASIAPSGYVVTGLDPMIYASIVAFGIVYAKQPVQFFAVLPLTGKQMMIGFLVFLAFFTVLNGVWEQGAAFAAAILVAVLMVSKFSPGLAWSRWRIRRARAKLSVLEGGADRPAVRRRDEQKYLN
jgi:membrane associated rhomboid family serine protease